MRESTDAKKGRYTGFKPVTGFKLVRAQREGERSESETGFERSENDSEASPNLEIGTRILQKRTIAPALNQ